MYLDKGIACRQVLEYIYICKYTIKGIFQKAFSQGQFHITRLVVHGGGSALHLVWDKGPRAAVRMGYGAKNWG